MDVITLQLPNRNQTEFQIALVDEPAIESEFMMFNKTNHFEFKEVEGEEGLLMGYFMIADMEIPRYDEKRGYYKVRFPKEAINTIVENFQLNGLAKNMNEMHQTGNLLDGVFVRNHWQIDSKKGIEAPKGFKTEADGSWFGVVKCENPEVKEKVKQGLFKGFSIEGRFIEDAIDKYFKDTDKTLNNKIKTMSKEAKEFFSAIMSYFNETDNPETTEHKFEEVTLADGVTKATIEPAIEVGATINLIAEDGTPIPAPIGKYPLEDGKVIVVEVEGIVALIEEVPADAPEEEMTGETTSADSPKENEAVKRLIERVEKIREFEKEIADLKKENDFLHKENDAIKTQFAELKKSTEETFAKLLGAEAKEPVQPVKRGFGLEKEKSIYKFLNK